MPRMDGLLCGYWDLNSGLHDCRVNALNLLDHLSKLAFGLELDERKMQDIQIQVTCL